MNIQSYPLSNVVTSALVGKTASERKFSALDSADEVGLRGLSHGKGKVAKAAAGALAVHDSAQIAYSIGMGNLAAFATIYAGKTGLDVRFGLKDSAGQWVRKPADDFRKFGGVLEHALLQLQVKGKDLTAKGEPSSAAADLHGLISLHTKACQVMDRRDAEQAAKRAEQDRVEQELLTLEAIELAIAKGEATQTEADLIQDASIVG